MRPSLRPLARLLVLDCRRHYAAKRPADDRFSRSSAYYGADKLQIKPSQSLYTPSYYDTDEFQSRRLLLAVGSIVFMLTYFAYLRYAPASMVPTCREPNDIDMILNSPPHVLASNLQRKMIQGQIDEARRAGKDVTLLEAELAYVDVKEAAVKATYQAKTM